MAADDQDRADPAPGLRILIAAPGFLKLAVGIAVAVASAVACGTVAWAAEGAAGAPDVPSAAAPEAPSPDDDAEILERLKAGDVAGAAALADAAFARDETVLHLSAGARADHVERLAVRFYEAGTLESATHTERLFEKTLALRESDAERDSAALATTLHDFSGVLFNRGAYERAEVLERRALDIREQVLPLGDLATARSRRDLGIIAMAQGRLADAEASLVPAMEVFESSARSRARAAESNAATGSPSESGSKSASPPESTSASAASADEWFELAVGRNSLAELRRQQGDYDGAAAILEKLEREAATNLGETSPQFPYLLNDLAGVYRDQGRYDDAETLLRRSLALRRAAPPDASAVPRALLNLADLYRDQDKREPAASLYAEALAGARAALGRDNPELFEYLNQLAVLLRDEGAYAKAEPLLREALAFAEKGFGADHWRVALSHLDLAELLRTRGRCEAARPHFDRALAVREKAFGPTHPDVAEVLVESASCRSTDAAGRRAARAELDRAIAILGDSEAHPAVEVDALEARARLLRSSGGGARGAAAAPHQGTPDAGERAQAERDLDRAIGVVERMRPHRGGGESVRASFFGRYKRLYDLAVRWEVEEERVDAALTTAERARGRVLLDQLAAAGVGDASSRDPEIARRLAGARTQLAETRQRIAYEQARQDLPVKERAKRVGELERRLAQDTRAFQELHDEARNTSPAWRGAIGAEIASADEIRRLVPRDGWLLRYQVGAERSYLFAVPPEGAVQVFSLQASAADARELSISAGPLTESALARALLGTRGSEREGSGRASDAGVTSGAGGTTDETGASAAGGTGGAGGPVPGGMSITSGPGGSGERRRPSEGLLARLASPQRGQARGIGGISTGSDPGARGLHALWRVLVPARLWARMKSASQVLVVPDGPLFLLPFEALVVAPGADPATSYWLDDGPVVRYAPSASFLVQLGRMDASRERATASPGAERVLSVADPDYGAAARPVRAPLVGKASGGPGRVQDDEEEATPRQAGAAPGDARDEVEASGRERVESPSTRTTGNSARADEPPSSGGSAAERHEDDPADAARSSGAGNRDTVAGALRGGTLARLPGTAHESDLVREALQGVADVVVLRGAEAREPAVRAEFAGKRYLHIATHALVDQDGGELFAELALTPPPQDTAARGDDDGFLQLFEIYDLRMDCELAVLSACSSNTGKVVAGEGIFALSRGFLLGGARRVVASQWSVEDISTAELVGDLFQRLAASEKAGTPMDAARALRDAKRMIRKQPARAHPFYWAPFVITGME